MHVAQILKLKGRDVETVRANVPLMEVAQRLSSRRIGAIVVVDGVGDIVGIVSERDIVRVIGRDGPGALEQQVAAVMTRGVVTCREADTVDQLMAEMTQRRFRHMPVVEGGRLVGIVSIGDVVKHRVAEVENEAAAMRDYIAAV